MVFSIDNEILKQFGAWYKEAELKEPSNPNAMALATSASGGSPSVRIVLMKSYDNKGFVFFTNMNSQKGRDLKSNPKVSTCFHWKSIDKQVRMEGSVVLVDPEEADVYFASRPRASQIGAWASKQSEIMEGRFVFESRIAKYSAKFNVMKIPRPNFWGGFRIMPFRVEFWNEYSFRLHDRNVYILNENKWSKHKLFP